MAKRSAIEVRGLKELKKALRELGPEFQKGLRQAGKDVSIEVSKEAKGAAQSLGGVAAKSAPAIRNTNLSSNLLGAGVVINGDAYPYALGAEFGGGARPSTSQFQPWRGSGPDAGYFVYPTIRRNSSKIEDRFLGALDDALQAAALT